MELLGYKTITYHTDHIFRFKNSLLDDTHHFMDTLKQCWLAWLQWVFHSVYIYQNIKLYSLNISIFPMPMILLNKTVLKKKKKNVSSNPNIFLEADEWLNYLSQRVVILCLMSSRYGSPQALSVELPGFYFSYLLIWFS